MLTNNSAGSFVRCRHKNRVARDAVHVDASAALDVVHVNVAVLGDQINNVVFRRHLHCNGKIVLSLRREEDVNGLFLVRLVAGRALPHL